MPLDRSTAAPGDGVATSVPGARDGEAFDRLVAAVAEPVFEARRRDERHFERVALTLPEEADGDISLVGAEAMAPCAAADAPRPSGRPSCTWRELVREIADVLGVAVRDATDALAPDAVGALVRLELQQAPAVTATMAWRARVQAIVASLRAQHEGRPAPRFDALPGLERRLAADGRTRYLRCGVGPQALLLVNAFGLTLDVWHELARRMSSSLRVLVLDAASASGDVADDPYYGVPEAPAAFAQAVRALLDAEGLASCHVASWCGGSKLALELARRLPGSVASLALLAPSFAGEAEGDADSEGDSSFESRLATMCQVVERLPASAAGMARSMQAMLASSASASASTAPAAPGGADDADGSAVFALHDRVTAPWLHAPFEDGARMLAYSRQLLAFRAHRVAARGAAPDAGADLPRMLVTGELDATTNNRRARALLAHGGALAHFELQRAGHYFVHQNAALVAPLLLDFLQHGTRAEPRHARIRRVPDASETLLVSGEL
jgi:pimeloyl-ACP methyl ester carboxylesterase